MSGLGQHPLFVAAVVAVIVAIAGAYAGYVLRPRIDRDGGGS